MNITDQPKLLGVSHLNEKGQLVIPKEAREFLGVGPGERVLVMTAPFLKAIVIARPEDLEAHLSEMMSSTQTTIDKLKANHKPGTD